MDVQALTADLAGLLARALPFLLKAGGEAGEAAAKEAGKALGAGAWKQAQALWRRLQPKVEAEPKAAGAVEDVVESPDDPDVQAALRVQLRKVLTADAGLAAELAKLLADGHKTTYRARQRGSGALAQGKRNVVAGKKGLAAGRDVKIVQKTTIKEERPGPREAELRRHYLGHLAGEARDLPLSVVDPGVPADKAGARLSVDAVYTALLTDRTEEVPKGNRWPGFDRRPSSALEQLDRHPRLVLLGDPGSGKSTFLNYVALCLAGEALKLPGANLETLTEPLPEEGSGEEKPRRQPWRHGQLLPVRVVLREFAARGLPAAGEKGTAKHLWDFLKRELEAAGHGEYFDYLRRELMKKGGRGLLLFDGLDEVPEAETRREQIRQVLDGFLKGLGSCRVLLTSRTYAYRNQGWGLPGFEEAVLAPFSRGQIRRFVGRWYARAAPLYGLKEEEAAGRAALLKHAIFGNGRLLDLARRPLLLTLMASLHGRGGSLPERREKLYEQAVELLLDIWESQRVVSGPKGEPLLRQPSLAEYLQVGKEKVRKALEELAYEAHAKQEDGRVTADIAREKLVDRLLELNPGAEVKAKLLVEHLRDRAGLLEERGVGKYAFPHRTFQEYLAACHLARAATFPEEVAELGRKEPGRWREVVLLAGARGRDVGGAVWQLAEALCELGTDETASELEDVWGARLAGQVVVESADLDKLGKPQQRKLERLRGWLERLLRDERLPALERVGAGRDLAKLGDPRFDPELWYLPRKPASGFMEVPAGPFLMGSDKRRDREAQDDELPQHEVDLPTFYLGRYPVTVAQYGAFVAATDRPLAPRSLEQPANHPMSDVTWHDALAYCRWLEKRLRAAAPARLEAERSAEGRRLWEGIASGSLRLMLPSEAEWEKAARGADGWIYPWGDEIDPERANYDATGVGGPSPVGCFPRGASPCGCEELSGNVWEWTRSEDRPYPYEARDGREDLAGAPLRVLRGGSYISNSGNCRCACRNRLAPSSWHRLFGFRVAAVPFTSGL
jgi:formylglycine-generating enzyme required for sulfatase activity